MTKPYLGNATWYRERYAAIVARVEHGEHPHLVAQDVQMSPNHVRAILRANGWRYHRRSKQWMQP